MARDLTKHNEALEKAKIDLMLQPDCAFFVSLCFSRKHVFDESIPTAATNGKVIKYNPDFFLALPPDVRLTTLIHETMHGAYLHIERVQDDMCHSKANIAMDYVINLQLRDRGFTVPNSWYVDDKFRDMSWEQIYVLLPDNLEPHMEDLEFIDDDTEIKELTKIVQDQLIQAAMYSKQAGDIAGTIPNEVTIYLDKLLNPKLPWNKILKKFFHNFDKSNYSFRKPNKKFLPKFFMPTLMDKALIDITVAIDTSGSVTQSEFLRFVTEIASIVKNSKPRKLTLIQFDTQIKLVSPIKNMKQLLTTNFVGRGGTRISPVLDWARENKPKLLIVFTDGEFYFEDEDKLNTPVIWLIHNNPEFTSTFGKVIHYETE